MASTEREEVVPAPPPYAAVNQEEQQRGPPPAQTSRTQYAPPSGPPPPPAASTNGYAPPPGPPPPSVAASDTPSEGPPSLAAAPPIYEPFSFASAYHTQTHGATPPRWHAPPAYHVYFDSHSSKLTFHLIIPSTEPPCACGTAFECECGRRRPALWTATRIGTGTLRFERFSPNSATTTLAFEAGKSRNVLERHATAIKDQTGKQVSSVKKKGDVWITRDLEDKQQTWQSHGDKSHHRRLELTSTQNQGLPLAIFRPSASSEPGRVELTSLAWGRMPSDELECDYSGGCDFYPLYGFVFRCTECSQDDTFDICEAHLAQELFSHNQTHHFKRQPRPYTEHDDAVRETPLLREPDLALDRKRQELILCSLAVVLLMS